MTYLRLAFIARIREHLLSIRINDRKGENPRSKIFFLFWAPGRARSLGGVSPQRGARGNCLPDGESTHRGVESAGSRRQNAGSTNRNRIRGGYCRMRRQISSSAGKPATLCCAFCSGTCSMRYSLSAYSHNSPIPRPHSLDQFKAIFSVTASLHGLPGTSKLFACSTFHTNLSKS